MAGLTRVWLAAAALSLCLLLSVLASYARSDTPTNLRDGVASSLLSWPTAASPAAASDDSALRLSVLVKDDVHAPHTLSASNLLAATFTPNTLTDLLVHVTYPSADPFVSPAAQLSTEQRQQLLSGLPQHAGSGANTTLFVAYTTTTAKAVSPLLVESVCARMAEALHTPVAVLREAGCETVYGSMLLDEAETDLYELTALWLGWQAVLPAPRLQQCSTRSSQHCKRMVYQRFTLPQTSLAGHDTPPSLFAPLSPAIAAQQCNDAVHWSTLLGCLTAQFGQQQQLHDLRASRITPRSLLLTLAADESVQLVETATAQSPAPSLTHSSSSSSLVQFASATSSASSSSSSSSSTSSSSSSSASSSSSSTTANQLSTPVLRMSRSLTGQGFHLNLSHSLYPASLASLPCPPAQLHLVYALPHTFYLDLHVAANGFRLQPHNTVRLRAYTDVDVELPADKSGQHVAVVSAQRGQLLQPGAFSAPLHLRYQAPALGRRYGDAALPLPLSAWLQCEGGEDERWVNVRVEWAETGELAARVPVGSVEDAPMAYVSAAGCSFVGTVVLAVALWLYPVRREVQAEHSE